MTKAISADTRRRINRHIANLGSVEENVAQKAEIRLLRFGKKAIGQLTEVVSSDNPQVRFRAVYLLGKSGDPQVLSVILRFIDDPDETVRYDAVMALGYLGDRRAIPVLSRIGRDCPASGRPCLCCECSLHGVKDFWYRPGTRTDLK